MSEFAGKGTRTEAPRIAAASVQQAPGKHTLVEQLRRPEPAEAAPQAAADGSAAVHSIARAGASGPGAKLPFLDRIQAAFGRHDVSGIQSHTDASAAAANAEMGSRAYARGSDVVFGGSPDLHTAAHEAAHVVQQRAGVHLKTGVGEHGDAYERHADAVADAVVAGGSAESLLSTMTGAPGDTSAAAEDDAVQFVGTPPRKGERRKFTLEQYIAMWEKEQSRRMSPDEKTTLRRGCIGITAVNLEGKGNPIDSAKKVYGDFERAEQHMLSTNKLLDDAAKRLGTKIDPARLVLFAKLFWSNQAYDPKDREESAENAFRPNKKTGEVDMRGYYYEPRAISSKGRRVNLMNYDYGFWDPGSQSFWHANHGQSEHSKKDTDRMQVLQSTREEFERKLEGNAYDRIVYCVAFARRYNPRLASIVHAKP